MDCCTEQGVSAKEKAAGESILCFGQVGSLSGAKNRALMSNNMISERNLFICSTYHKSCEESNIT
jgi:hypothetical protein